MKKLLAIVLTIAMVLSFAACAKKDKDPEPVEDPKPEAKMVNIGILQFAPHASLDNCFKGIVQGLQEKGFTDGVNNVHIEFVNGMGEMETNNLAAQSFVNKKFDIIIAIATPSANAAYAAAKEAGIPVVFSAVSDPLAAGLVKDLNNPQTGATGTSDNLNYTAQFDMIKAFQPNAKKIGFLYTTSEANSVSQLAKYKEIAPNYGFEIEAIGIADHSEIASGIATLVTKKVDAVCNLTDNNVVNNFSVVTAATDPAGIPCYGSEEEQVAQYGCVASETLDYVALGKQTGIMAAEVLGGKDINTYAVGIVSDSEPVYSEANLAKFNMTVPAAYAEARMVDPQVEQAEK